MTRCEHLRFDEAGICLGCRKNKPEIHREAEDLVARFFKTIDRADAAQATAVQEAIKKPPHFVFVRKK
jgi:hypothetical protein